MMLSVVNRFYHAAPRLVRNLSTVIGSTRIHPVVQSASSITSRQCSSTVATRIHPVVQSASSITSRQCSSTVAESAEPTQEVKPKLNIGRALELCGDINNVAILGTIIKIEILNSKKMKTSEETQDESSMKFQKSKWAILYVRTIFSSRGRQKSRIVLHRVHLHLKRQLDLVGMLSVGDRVYVSGKLTVFSSKNTGDEISYIEAKRFIALAATDQDLDLEETVADNNMI